MVDCSTIGKYQLHGLLRHGCIDTQNDGALEVVLLEITLKKTCFETKTCISLSNFQIQGRHDNPEIQRPSQLQNHIWRDNHVVMHEYLPQRISIFATLQLNAPLAAGRNMLFALVCSCRFYPSTCVGGSIIRYCSGCLVQGNSLKHFDLRIFFFAGAGCPRISYPRIQCLSSFPLGLSDLPEGNPLFSQ